MVPASNRYPLITWPATSSSAAIVTGHIRYKQILHV
jgi:hypothetical protein